MAEDADPARAPEVIRSEFSSVEDFERDFPSLCFALATGVGKTRLIGAFISYLFPLHKFHDFFSTLSADQGPAKGLGLGQLGYLRQGLDVGACLVRGGYEEEKEF